MWLSARISSLNNFKSTDKILGSLMKKLSHAAQSFLLIVTVAGCQSTNLEHLKSGALSKIGFGNSAQAVGVSKRVADHPDGLESLQSMIGESRAAVDLGVSFSSALKASVSSDPKIIASIQNIEASEASLKSTKAMKEFQVSGSFYGGIEDVSDETSGLALVLDASKLMYDAGQGNAKIASEQHLLDAARYDLAAQQELSAYNSAKAWVELERYRSLKKLIDDRLQVLNPLITQLEKVVDAGVGDVSSVAAAQRTVSTIRVAQTDVLGGLERSELNFINIYGALPSDLEFDSEFVTKIMPKEVSDDMARKAPALLAKYSNYKSAQAALTTATLQGEFNVGLQARVSRPFGGSEHDSDESIGLVARKTLSNGGMFESDVDRAKALVSASEATLKATYREGSRTVQIALQTISLLSDAITLAKESAEVTADEITYLRQQLIIGGSTLQNVLSAEARLYDAESKGINFVADRRNAQLTVLSTLGLIGPSLGL